MLFKLFAISKKYVYRKFLIIFIIYYFLLGLNAMKKIIIIFLISSFLSIAKAKPLILISDANGIEWTQNYSDEMYAVPILNNITQKDGSIFILGNNAILQSNDQGSTWKLGYTFPQLTYPFGISANNYGIMVGTNQLSKTYLNYSNDNLNSWKQTGYYEPGCGFIEKPNKLAASPDTFLLIGKYNCYWSTPSGETAILPIAVKSIDGTTWTKILSLPDSINTNDTSFDNIIWSGAEWFLLVTKNKKIMLLTSKNTDIWTEIIIPNKIKTITEIATNGYQWIASGTYEDNGAIKNMLLKSENQGKSWIFINDISPSITINKIHFNKNRWVAVGKSGENENVPVILTSTDGSHWQQAKLPAKVMQPTIISSLDDIIWTGTKWIAIGTYSDDNWL